MVDEEILPDKPKKRLWAYVFALVIITILIILLILFYIKRSNEDIGTVLPDETYIVTEKEELNVPHFLDAILKDNISICDEADSNNPANCRDEYFLYKSMRDNKNLCGNIQEMVKSKSCLMIFSGRNECTELEGDSQAICKVFFGASTDICGDIGDQTTKDYCLYIQPLMKGISEHDKESCSIINHASLKYLCTSLSS